MTESGKARWVLVMRLLGPLGMSSACGAPATPSTAPSFPCAGLVQDVYGQPVSETRIECYRISVQGSLSSGAPELEQVTTTGRQGRFKLSVSYSPKLLVAQRNEFAPTWTYAAESSEREWRLLLPPPCKLSGLVLDKEKLPVADAEVMAVWVQNVRGALQGRFYESILPGALARKLFSVRTSADGSFQINGFPTEASVMLAARKPGLASPPTYSKPESWSAGVTGPAGLQDIQLKVEPTGSIEGRVTVGGTELVVTYERKEGVRRPVPVLHPGQPGQPVAKATVVMTRVSENWAETRQVATTTADGVFRFADVAAGEYRLTGAGETAGLMITATACHLSAGQAVTNLILRLVPAGTLTVSIRSSEDGRPVPGAALSVNDDIFICDLNGSATIHRAAGDCQVHVQKPRFQESGFHTNINAGRITKVDFKLAPLPKISGLVLNPAGKPVARAQVTAFITEPNPEFETESRADGTFDFSWHRNWDSMIRPYSGVIVRDLINGRAAYVPIVAGERQLVVKLQPGLKISGRVTDMQGGPVPVAACLRDSPGPGRVQFPARTGADGRFEINAIPKSHAYDILPLSPGYRRVPLHVPPGQTNDVELAPISLDREPQIH